MRYEVARNPLGTVTNAPLASDMVKELRPQKLIMLEINGFQVKR